MTEKDLRDFIDQHHPESETLEYKSKPNVNVIKKIIKHIQKRMHYNIVKSIFAFANTNGGHLYIGIRENKKKEKLEIVGVDKEDENIIKDMLKRVATIISYTKEIIKLKKLERNIIHITVQPLKLYDKPQLLNGVLYFRDGNKTELVKRDGWKELYEKKQLYFYVLEGIKNNLNKIIQGDFKDIFVTDNFITGLKEHINSFNKKDKVIDKKAINKAINKAILLLNKIKDVSNKQVENKYQLPKDVKEKQPQKQLIDDFIKTYKQIMDLGV